MNGDRLKTLEEGFMEGKLSPKEEAELKVIVEATEHHHLKTYFQWTDSANELEVPDMASRVDFEDAPRPFWRQHFSKVAASLLILIVAAFIFREELFENAAKPVTYSQAEIDESYEATIATLTAMAFFLDEGLNNTERGIDFSTPFKEFNTLQNNETQNP